MQQEGGDNNSYMFIDYDEYNHPILKILNDQEDDENTILEDEEKKLWGSFRGFLQERGGADFIKNFMVFRGCKPGCLCLHCAEEIYNLYCEQLDQHTYNIIEGMEDSRHGWNCICNSFWHVLCMEDN